MFKLVNYVPIIKNDARKNDNMTKNKNRLISDYFIMPVNEINIHN